MKVALKLNIGRRVGNRDIKDNERKASDEMRDSVFGSRRKAIFVIKW